MEKHLAIQFVDIADSTPLYERIGNLAAAQLTRKMLMHLRLTIEVNGGWVVKMLGDGLLAAFPTADEAAWASIAMIDSQDIFDLQLRIGLNHGAVIQRQEDLYGDACNVAARVEAIAKPGEILATADFARRLCEHLRRRTRLLSDVAIKGKNEPISIHQLLPGETASEESQELRTLAAGDLHGNPFGPGEPTLGLSYQGRPLTLNRTRRRLTVGRDEACDLRILSRQTSRQHAVIDFSRESFILTDHSTNGTFVATGSSVPVLLRRDTTKLLGQGLIGFGAEPEEGAGDHVVAFRCERH